MVGETTANDILSPAESMAMIVRDGARACKIWGRKKRGVDRHHLLEFRLVVWVWETPFMMT